jgi:uncharacterized protein with HEPN domain
MNRQTAKRLLDALTAAGWISRYASGRSFGDYEWDDYFRSAVERQFEVLAEALNTAKGDDPDVALLISELPEIIRLRNKLAHRYDTVDDQIVWDTVTQGIPLLLVRLESLLATAPPPGRSRDPDDDMHPDTIA